MGFLQILQTLFDPHESPRRDAFPQRGINGGWHGSRSARLRNEVLMVAPRFAETGGIQFDENCCDWLMIPKYPLPAKWQNRWCNLLLIFPDTYPIAPPIGFYLNQQFKLKAGGTDPHLIGFGAHNAPDLRGQGWYWYCVRMADGSSGGWYPGPDYRQPDNLWTFLNMVRETLTNDF